MLPESLERSSRRNIWQALSESTPLGWLQLKKSKSRLIVAIAGIGFADLLMFAQLGIQAALFDSNTMLNRGMDADIILHSAQYRDLNLADTMPRIPDPGDRRGTLIRLTDQGFTVIEAAVEAHVANLHCLLQVLKESERQALAQLLRQLLISFEE
jgi:hypothetical protein